MKVWNSLEAILISRLANNYFKNLKRIKELNSNNKTMCRKTFFCMNEHYLNASYAICDCLSNEIHSFDWLLNIDTSCDSLFKKNNKVYNLHLSNLWCFDTSFKQTICNHSLCAKATIWYLDRSGSSHCL